MHQPNQVASNSAISGTVLMDTGEPIADAVVTIAKSSADHSDIGALTNEWGEFRFDSLMAGDYTILVNAAGFKVTTKSILVKSNLTSNLEIVLSK